MELLGKLTGWLQQMLKASVAVLALAVVLQLLFGSGMPFFPVDVVGNIVAVTKQLGSEGLVGLIAAWVLFSVLNSNSPKDDS